MGNYDSIDFWSNEDGDINTGANGDVESTEEDYIISLQQKIRSLVKSSNGDWLDYPTFASNLHAFVGQPNTRENALRMERVVKNSLVNGGVVSSEDIEVTVNAAGIHSVYVEIIVKTTSTIFNKTDGKLNLGFFFSSTDGNVLWGKAPRGGM